MPSTERKHAVSTFLTFSLLLTAGCAGISEPPAPLWDSAFYQTVAVLPVRMTVLTGGEYFQSEDTELSNRMGAMVQESLSVVMRQRGYDVLAPEDLSERLMKEDDLSEAFAALASAHGYMGKQGGASWEDAMGGAALIGEKLGADLLVLAHGNGEYHSFEETLFQGLVTGFLSKGREQYRTPPSYLNLDVYFVDPRAGVRLARILPRRFSYEQTVVALSRRLNSFLRRVPVKQGPGDGTGEAGQAPGP
jgi:hypothetical protein